MAYNDQTSAKAKRTALYENVDRPSAAGGAAKIQVDVLMPYSFVEIDGVTYIETNSTYAISEGGGFHAMPAYGVFADEQWSSRAQGVRSVDVPAGTVRGNPAESIVHKQGWI